MRLLATLLVSVLFLSTSCKVFEQAGATLTTPYSQIDTDPSAPGIQPAKDSPRTPLQDIVENVPGVAANPAWVPGWLEIAGALATVVFGAAGAYKVGQRQERKKNGGA